MNDEYVVCKACGYVMKKNRLKDKCPACGVPAKMFQPFDDKLKPRRRFLINLDAHPIAVHLPLAFTVTVFFLLIAALFFRGEPRDYLEKTIAVLTYCLPFVTLAGIAAGLFDAKIRFRKLSTEILIKKIAYSLAFFILTVTAFIIVLINPLDTVTISILIIVFLGIFACGVILGLLGKGLLIAKFPG